MIIHLVLDGVAEGPLGVGVDVVDTAQRLLAVLPGAGRLRAGALKQRVVSLDGKPVRSGTGRSISVHGALRVRDLVPGDVLVLPGLSAVNAAAIEALVASPPVLQVLGLLRRAHAKGATLGASCSATFVLAASGLLAGHSATTTWWLAPEFMRRFPDVTLQADQMVVESGGVLTAGSSFAHADLMLALLSRIAGPSLAHLVMRYLVLDERPSQARYMVMEHLRSADPVLRALEKFVAANLHRQLRLEDLARATATSARTLARRVEAGLGMTPHAFVQRLRVDRAAHLLETTGDSVDEVAARVGYADAAAFRRVFKRHTGQTPRGRAATPRRSAKRSSRGRA